MKIFAGRASLLGDVCMTLPLLHVLKQLYPNSSIDFPLAPKSKQIAPLFLFHDQINKIVLTQNNDRILNEEYTKLVHEYDLVINPFPQHPREQDWFNYRNCVEESILMAGEQYYEVFKSLPRSLQKPRLNKWWNKPDPNPMFKMDQRKKSIAIHCQGGYGQSTCRAPSQSWWRKLVDEIHDLKEYKVIQFGHPNDFEINEWTNDLYQAKIMVYDYRHLSLFEQIQHAVECDVCVTGDTGFGWILSAVGVNKSISLLTFWENNHYKNPLSLAPQGWKNNEINLFAEGGCSNIDINKVIESIK